MPAGLYVAATKPRKFLGRLLAINYEKKRMGTMGHPTVSTIPPCLQTFPKTRYWNLFQIMCLLGAATKLFSSSWFWADEKSGILL
jgi:hypothetical protein